MKRVVAGAVILGSVVAATSVANASAEPVNMMCTTAKVTSNQIIIKNGCDRTMFDGSSHYGNMTLQWRNTITGEHNHRNDFGLKGSTFNVKLTCEDRANITVYYLNRSMLLDHYIVKINPPACK